MYQEHRERMYQAATAEVARFVQTNADFSLDSEQSPGVLHQRKGGGTNFVLWENYLDDQVVFKYFDPDWGACRYRNEMACIRHFVPTGWVPKVYAAVPESLIVMSCLQGRFIGQEVTGLSASEQRLLGIELGEALGRMVDLGLPEDSSGYSVVRDFDVIPWNADLRKALEFYIGLCRRDQHLSPSGADPFYDESLELVESQISRVANQRRVIYHEDFHCFAHHGRLKGVFDLEMARQGTELMQLERAFQQCEKGGLNWDDVMQGYTGESRGNPSDVDYVFMLAMSLFYYHIRITRWGNPDSKAVHVAEFLPDLREEAGRYVSYVDLGEYLPSL